MECGHKQGHYFQVWPWNILLSLPCSISLTQIEDWWWGHLEATTCSSYRWKGPVHMCQCLELSCLREPPMRTSDTSLCSSKKQILLCHITVIWGLINQLPYSQILEIKSQLCILPAWCDLPYSFVRWYNNHPHLTGCWWELNEVTCAKDFHSIWHIV